MPNLFNLRALCGLEILQVVPARVNALPTFIPLYNGNGLLGDVPMKTQSSMAFFAARSGIFYHLLFFLLRLAKVASVGHT